MTRNKLSYIRSAIKDLSEATMEVSKNETEMLVNRRLEQVIDELILIEQYVDSNTD